MPSSTDAIPTLVAALLSDPEGPPISIGEGRRTKGYELSRAEWIERGRRFAFALAARGVEPGDRVALVLPTALPFFVALLGAWLARAAVSPLCPPAASGRGARQEHGDERLAALLALVDPKVVIGASARGALAARPDLADRVCLDEEEVLALSSTSSELAGGPGPDDVGLVQFSSGSTGVPKGIVLAHRQILANVAAIGGRARVVPGDSMVSWLPLHHDMGLIGSICCPLGWSIPVRILPTEAFAARPTVWLAEIARRRATFSPAPASAFDLAARLGRARDGGSLDLSCWRYAWVGAEPVYPRVLDGFAAAFAASGLRREALRPCYGLAEATVCATMPEPGEPTRIERVDLESLRRDGFAAPAAYDGKEASRAAAFAGNGRALDGLELAILDDDGRPFGDRCEGRIAIRGESVSRGYRGEPARSAASWLDTGDLGFLIEGELFVTGRRKDVLIRGGAKFHPHELETAAGEVEGVRSGGAAAFSDLDAKAERERIVLAIEPLRRGDVPLDLRSRVQRHVSQATGVLVDEVEVVPHGAIPRTTSGKVQRQRARELWRRGAWSEGVAGSGS